MGRAHIRRRGTSCSSSFSVIFWSVRTPLDAGDDAPIDLGVVNCVAQIIGTSRRGQIGVEGEIDFEHLAEIVFAGEYPVSPENLETLEVDAVPRRPGVCGWWWWWWWWWWC